MKYSFILYRFDIRNVGILFYIFGQTLKRLTADNPNMQSKKKRREYKLSQLGHTFHHAN